MEIQRIGNIYGDEFGTGYAGNVFLADGLSPTLTNMQGGGRQPMVVEIIEVKDDPKDK